MMELTEPGLLFKYMIVTSAVTFLPVMLFGSLTDSVLVRLQRQELWAYALAGLIVGAFIGWFLGTFTPQSDDDERSIATMAWPLALFGLIASSTFWWLVRRKSQGNSGNSGDM